MLRIEGWNLWTGLLYTAIRKGHWLGRRRLLDVRAIIDLFQ